MLKTITDKQFPNGVGSGYRLPIQIYSMKLCLKQLLSLSLLIYRVPSYTLVSDALKNNVHLLNKYIRIK